MGKRNKNNDIDTETTEFETPSADAPKPGGKAILLDLEDGRQVKRADYIRERADAGLKRAEIAKELTTLQGKEVAYQVVFAATKRHPNYAKKAELADDDVDTTETTE